MPNRRFPAPWRADKRRDANGQEGRLGRNVLSLLLNEEDHIVLRHF